ncbi:MAG: DUF1667 domain-containing protein [Candidatus Omnitrophota bacterium]
MNKKITCIECPKGCVLRITAKDRSVLKVIGHECPKGEKYASAEIENPVRILTSTVRASGLSLAMIPVRTDRPIPKGRIFEAMEVIKRAKISKPVKIGVVIIKNILGLDVNVIATRDCY